MEMEMETGIPDAPSGLESGLARLVRLRTSHLIGCTSCTATHAEEARAAGESEQRIRAVARWREAPLFTPRERAALGWADAVTGLGRAGVPDDVYEEARAHFRGEELVSLTAAVVGSNVWSRLVALARLEPTGW